MLKSQPYIILVDDDENNIERLSFSLACFGISTKLFESGFEVINYLNQIAGSTILPSVIILNKNLPKVNGRQLLILMKSSMVTQHIPVVIYYNYITGQYRDNLLKCGAHCCLRKWNTQLEFSEHVKLFKDLAWTFTTIDSMA